MFDLITAGFITIFSIIIFLTTVMNPSDNRIKYQEIFFSFESFSYLLEGFVASAVLLLVMRMWKCIWLLKVYICSKSFRLFIALIIPALEGITLCKRLPPTSICTLSGQLSPIMFSMFLWPFYIGAIYMIYSFIVCLSNNLIDYNGNFILMNSELPNEITTF